MDVISRLWLSLVQGLGLSERLTFLLGVYLVSELWYLFVAGFYYLCWAQDWFLRYRIQKRATMPDNSLIKKCLEEVCVRSALGRLPFLFILFDAFKYMGMEVFAPLPPWPTVLKHWVLALAINDTLFYWTHRLMHHRLLYKHFHKKHHEFRVNISVNSEYAGLVEVTMCDVLPTLAGCLLLGSHLLVMLGWTSFRVWETCAAHSGYAFPWCPFAQLPFFNGPQMHDYHHSHNVGAYGAVTRFWDAWIGTDGHYQDHARQHPDPYIPCKGRWLDVSLSAALLPSLDSIWSLAAAASLWWEGGEEGKSRLVRSNAGMFKSSSSSSVCSIGSSTSTDGNGFESSNEGSSNSNENDSRRSSSKGELKGDLLASPSAATPHHMCIEASNNISNNNNNNNNSNGK